MIFQHKRLFLLVAFAILSSCANEDFTGVGGSGAQDKFAGSNGSKNGDNKNPNSKEIVKDANKSDFNIKHNEVQEHALSRATPALAVRSPACLMCHAKIGSNMITDLGYGDPFFLGGKNFAMQQGGEHSKFNKYSNSYSFAWQTAEINGNLLIPKVKISAADADFLERFQLNDQSTLKNIFLDRHNFLNGVGEAEVETTFTKENVASGPGLHGKILEKSKVLIGTVTPDRIKKLLSLDDVKKAVTQSDLVIAIYKDSIFKDYKQHVNEGRYYVELTGETTCNGDVIIDGVVFINNVTLNTTVGCRLYVSKSVFITGEVKYKGSDKPTLQISSGRGIFLGIKSLETRLSYYTNGLRQAKTIAENTAFNNAIFSDSKLIKELTDDAGPFTKFTLNGAIAGYCTSSGIVNISGCFNTQDIPISLPAGAAVEWAEEFKRKTINQTGLLLNAPIVHSRYLGSYKGVVIAEDALFAVKRFQFDYDDAFNYAVFLPLLKDEILVIND